MVTFVPVFVSEATRTHTGPGDAPRATLSDVADHIEHVRNVAGIDPAGIGSDFDGIADTPVGLEDVSIFPALFAELSRRGWGEDDLQRLAAGNLLRAWREAESAGRRIQRTRPPSTKSIEELDGRPVSRRRRVDDVSFDWRTARVVSVVQPHHLAGRLSGGLPGRCPTLGSPRFLIIHYWICSLDHRRQCWRVMNREG